MVLIVHQLADDCCSPTTIARWTDENEFLYVADLDNNQIALW